MASNLVSDKSVENVSSISPPTESYSATDVSKAVPFKLKDGFQASAVPEAPVDIARANARLTAGQTVEGSDRDSVIGLNNLDDGKPSFQSTQFAYGGNGHDTLVLNGPVEDYVFTLPNNPAFYPDARDPSWKDQSSQVGNVVVIENIMTNDRLVVHGFEQIMFDPANKFDGIAAAVNKGALGEIPAENRFSIEQAVALAKTGLNTTDMEQVRLAGSKQAADAVKALPESSDLFNRQEPEKMQAASDALLAGLDKSAIGSAEYQRDATSAVTSPNTLEAIGVAPANYTPPRRTAGAPAGP